MNDDTPRVRGGAALLLSVGDDSRIPGDVDDLIVARRRLVAPPAPGPGPDDGPLPIPAPPDGLHPAPGPDDGVPPVAQAPGDEVVRTPAADRYVSGRAFDPVDCVVVPDRPRSSPLLAVDAELIVRSAGGARAMDLVRESRPDCTGLEVPGLDGRLQQLIFGQRIEVSELESLAETLNRSGLVADAEDLASLSHVTPLRIVVKGNCGPEPVDVDLPGESPIGQPGEQAADGAAAPPHVVVIDCGVFRSERTDHWLDDIDDPDPSAPAGAAIDPLDAFPLATSGDGTLDLAAGHGTFVAGIVRQVAPGAMVSMVRALDSDGVGSEVTVAQAMVRAAAAGADVINLSLGVQTVHARPLLAVAVAMEILRDRWPDVVVVAAAGNYGVQRKCYPGAQDGVVAVAALSDAHTGAAWSSRGAWVTCSTLGEDVVSTFVPGVEAGRVEQGDVHRDRWTGDNPWARWSGTSFSAPQVCGEIARRMLEAPDGQPRPTARQALDQLLATGTDAHDGFGRKLVIAPFVPA